MVGGLDGPEAELVTLSLTLLGGFQARLGTGAVLSISARKAQALLAYLGVRPGQSHSRDKLAALLWGESREAQARDGLRHALAALRQALPATAPPILMSAGQTLALNPVAVDVDVATFGGTRPTGGAWLPSLRGSWRYQKTLHSRAPPLRS